MPNILPKELEGIRSYSAGDAFGPRSHPIGRSLLRVSAAVAVSIAIAGCSEGVSNGREWQRDGLRVWIDPETTCRYLIYSRSPRSVAVTPLLKPNGLPDCVDG